MMASESGKPLTPEERELLAEARRIARRAQAPARERCGALVVTADGARHSGATVRLETAAPLSVCAEQVALCAARANSTSEMIAIFLWIPAAAGVHPCGQCLQIWTELAPQATFLLQRGAEPPQRLEREGLMPGPFTRFATDD